MTAFQEEGHGNGGGSRWRLGAGSWDRGGGGFVLIVAFAEEGAAPTFGLPVTTTAPWTPPPCRPLHRGTPRHRTWRGSLLHGVHSHHSTAGGLRAPIWVGGRGGFGAGAGRDFRGRDEIFEDGDDSWGGDGGGWGMEHGGDGRGARGAWKGRGGGATHGHGFH
jgi:hypothetical protein